MKDKGKMDGQLRYRRGRRGTAGTTKMQKTSEKNMKKDWDGQEQGGYVATMGGNNWRSSKRGRGWKGTEEKTGVEQGR